MRQTLGRSTFLMAMALLGAASVGAAQSGDQAEADRSPFEVLIAELLRDGQSAGRVENTSPCIDAATSGQSRWPFSLLIDQTTQIVGDNAIVRHTLTGETERDGKTNPVNIGVLMVWHTQNGDWKLLARQAVRREEPRMN
jgi:hypothetical protein